MRNESSNDLSKGRDLMEIYYWSKLTSDGKLAGGDIRAKYVIPNMMQISKDSCYLLLPETILRKELLANHQSLSKILLTLLMPLKLARVVKKSGKKIKFVYCSTCYSWDIFPAIFIKFLFYTKLICISHDTPKQLSGYSFYRENEKFSISKSIFFTLIGKFQLFLLRYVDVPVSISKFAMDFFVDPSVRGKAILSSNTVPYVLKKPIDSLRPYDIVLLGRIIPRKNVNKFINILKNKQYHRKITLLVITNSSISSVEREIVGDLDSNLLELTVKYDASEEEKFDLLMQSKVYVSLSKDENFSIAAMEAASMGCALILSDYSFFRDIYGDAAIYVDEAHAEEVWAHITNILSNPKILREYADKAIKIANRYLASDVARRDYELILEKIIGGEHTNET